MSYEKKGHSSSKNNVPKYNNKRKDSWKNKPQASTSRNPPITCYYCGLISHMKMDYKKRANVLKVKSFQSNKERLNEKNTRKRIFHQKIEQENLEKKKDLT